MTKNFNVVIAGHSLTVLTMNRVKPQLYMVYVVADGTKHRFHMQIDELGDFKVANAAICPEFILPLEGALSEDIKENGVVTVLAESNS